MAKGAIVLRIDHNNLYKWIVLSGAVFTFKELHL